MANSEGSAVNGNVVVIAHLQTLALSLALVMALPNQHNYRNHSYPRKM